MILLIGGTGKLGSRILEKLHLGGYEFKCFLRQYSEEIDDMGVEITYGSLEYYEDALRVMKGIDIVISTPCINGEYYENLIKACKESNIKQGIFISSTSIFTKLNAKSKVTKLKREKAIKESGIPYTIIRPTMIYGIKNDGNMCRLIKYLKKFPVMPIFGSGNYLMQPVLYDDLADAVIAAINNKAALNNEYNIAGLDEITYNQVVDTVAEALNKKILKVHLPYKLSLCLIKLFNKIIKNVIRVEQVERLNENKNFSIQKAQSELGYRPKSFKCGITNEVQSM